MSVAEFFSMGGYGLYVWGAYVVTAVLVAMELVAVRARLRNAHRLADGERETQ